MARRSAKSQLFSRIGGPDTLGPPWLGLTTTKTPTPMSSRGAGARICSTRSVERAAAAEAQPDSQDRHVPRTIASSLSRPGITNHAVQLVEMDFELLNNVDNIAAAAVKALMPFFSNCVDILCAQASRRTSTHLGLAAGDDGDASGDRCGGYRLCTLRRGRLVVQDRHLLRRRWDCGSCSCGTRRLRQRW